MSIRSANIEIPAQEWPALPLEAWKPTRDTLHMWTQMVGKVRLALSPNVNHWWDVTLYVSPRGLTTSAIPYGSEIFEIQFDFIDHKLLIQTSRGQEKTLKLAPRSVADFYGEFMDALHSLGINVKIWTTPSELPDPIPFEKDHDHASYDPEYVHRFWKILVLLHTVLEEFRARFIGKCSPVHFFWGSFDLAVTRFSGRPAPPRPGADVITRQAYSHEVSSVGFWTGGGDVNGPAFYSYMAPEPEGFSSQIVRPAAAFYHPQLKEFILMYDEARKAASPAAALLDFAQSTYEAGANLAKWDRANLEAHPDDIAKAG